LRAAGIACDMDLSARSAKSQFKLADRQNAAYCLIAGDEELAAGAVVLKDLATGEQSSVAVAEVVDRLRSLGL